MPAISSVVPVREVEARYPVLFHSAVMTMYSQKSRYIVVNIEAAFPLIVIPLFRNSIRGPAVPVRSMGYDSMGRLGH
ncbi:hypothetical protein [Nonomuraea sp. KM88]|uniref:hypothetical protein n=1 Tax=Nonomuraea sp. KM88 TaxID=3457427 RepID=UPI003FCD8F27